VAYLRLDEARAAFSGAHPGVPPTQLAASAVLRKSAAIRPDQSFDIFLSHSLTDAVVIAGVKAHLEQSGESVYVDWIDDPQLDRSRVGPATAALLRARMQASGAMIYAASTASPASKWMPWELGYFDGLKGERIAILPLVSFRDDEFLGQEYLGLYPKIEKLPTEGDPKLFVTKGAGSRTFMTLTDLRQGSTAFRSY
jgi:hypothetical protein